jgi:hypothetical protein
MSPETSSAVLGGLTDGVVGAVLGFLLAYLLFRLTQKRKLVEYSVSSISLLRLKPSVDSVLTVSVSKESLTGDPADHNEILSLNTVYGFQILLDVGNEDIEKIDDIEIRFDTAAKIVRCETDPISTTGYTITTQKDPAHLNMLRLSVPYLNAKASMVIRLITTENANSSCAVMVHGVGIRTRPARSLSFFINVGFTFAILLAVIAGLLSFIFRIQGVSIPPTTPQEWIYLILLIMSMVIVIYIYFSTIIQRKRHKFSQDWDWKMPEASEKQNFLLKWFSQK